MSQFYGDSVKVLDEYKGIKPGDNVAYENPEWQNDDGSYRTGGMDGPLVVTEIYILAPDIPAQAVLNDGEWECNCDNLRKIKVIT